MGDPVAALLLFGLTALFVLPFVPFFWVEGLGRRGRTLDPLIRGLRAKANALGIPVEDSHRTFYKSVSVVANCAWLSACTFLIVWHFLGEQPGSVLIPPFYVAGTVAGVAFWVIGAFKLKQGIGLSRQVRAARARAH